MTDTFPMGFKAFSNKQNALRAGRKIDPNVTAIQHTDGRWYWQKPAPTATAEAELGGLTEAEMDAELDLQEAALHDTSADAPRAFTQAELDEVNAEVRRHGYADTTPERDPEPSEAEQRAAAEAAAEDAEDKARALRASVARPDHETNALLAQATAQMERVEQASASPTLPKLDIERAEDIASRICGFETLAERKSDALDFREIAAWQMQKALEEAYDLGRRDERVAASRARKAGAAERQASAPRQPRKARDWTIKPTITSATNQHVQKLVDRIDAARGDLAALEAFTFKPSNTYYQLAANFRDALIAEARSA